MIAFTYIHYSIDDMSNMPTCMHYKIFMHVHFISPLSTCMILTNKYTKYKGLLVNKGVSICHCLGVAAREPGNMQPCNSDA